MLLQLENTNKENLDLLLDFAKKHELKLSLIDDDTSNYFLPGKPLNDAELSQLIEMGRKSGSINLEDAHALIRKSFNAG